MRAYPHIVKKVYYEPLAITVAKFMAIHAVLESRLTELEAGDHHGRGADRVEDFDIPRDGPTAIVNVTGIIGQHIPAIDTFSSGPMTDVDDVKTAIDVSEQDPSINRVLFRFDTPGGSAAGIPELGRKIFGMHKETVAFTDSECCSAGVWLASQCRHSYATPSSSVGSVGVWSAYTDLTAKLEKDGVKVNAISAGKYKLMGAWWKPMTDDERALLQAQVDKLHAEFKKAMNNIRQVDSKYLEGQIFDGEEAARIGMVDGLVEDIGDLLA
jgi:signal peptide peptidase SppA